MPVLKTSFSEGEIIAGNYRVLSIAGSGGMGVVYRALDQRLDRVVALKFLPAELNAIQRDKERFLREARTASALDHPNIGVIHGIEQTEEGLTFIVMAFYEGASLAERIHSGPLGVHEAMGIARQMALGLGEAHAHGIIHRDVKPSNVMLTASGLVKIVDFGLARAMTETTASQTGITGTVRYMSPEQAMDRALDQRCDIWALGVVFAEMLTGNTPFHADSITAMLYSILNEPPKGLEALHPALQPVLYQALAKDPEKRYGSCKEFIADLDGAAKAIPADAIGIEEIRKLPPAVRGGKTKAHTKRLIAEASRTSWGGTKRKSEAWNGPLGALVLLLAIGSAVGFIRPLRQKVLTLISGGPSLKHIAVLPFDNIGSNPENSALADGLMESLAGRLSNLDVGTQSLWIVPTSEVRRRKVTDPADALKDLGANLVIKGAVERDGNDIHLTVNLIDTKNLRQVGSAMLEDPAGDLSTLEDEAVSRLAKLMNISVTADMLRNTGGKVNPAAYEGYLTALGLMQRYDKPGNLDQAIAALQDALKTDPGFALGYGELGEAWRLKHVTDPNPKWLSEAEANAQKAVQLDNSIASVYVTLGRIHREMGQHDLALEEYQHAYSLDARNAEALAGIARVDEDAGKLAEAEAAYRKAADLQPNDWEGYNHLGSFLKRHGKRQEAIAEYRQALQLTPDNAQVLLNLGAAYEDSSDPSSVAQAEQPLKQSIAIAPSYAAWANLGLLYIRQKRYSDAIPAIRSALQLNPRDYNVWEDLRDACEWVADQSCAQDAADHEKPALLSILKSNPRNALASANYADLVARFGPRTEAEQYIRTALALSPDDPTVLEAVSAAWESLANRREAVKAMNHAFAKGLTWDVATQDPETQALLKDPSIKPPKKQDTPKT